MKEQQDLEKRFNCGGSFHHSNTLQYHELLRLCELLIRDRDGLRKALDRRNDIEGKAHALFTEPLNGHTFAHLPEQCNPLGFVTVMREALRSVLEGKILPKPFIYLTQPDHP